MSLESTDLSILGEETKFQMGPRKSRNEVYGNAFKAIGSIRGIAFQFAKRNQVQKSATVGVKRGYAKNPAI